MSGKLPYDYKVGDKVVCVRGGWGISYEHIGETFTVLSEMDDNGRLEITHETIEDSWPSVREFSVEPAPPSPLRTEKKQYGEIKVGGLFLYGGVAHVKYNSEYAIVFNPLESVQVGRNAEVEMYLDLTLSDIDSVLKDIKEEEK